MVSYFIIRISKCVIVSIYLFISFCLSWFQMSCLSTWLWWLCLCFSLTRFCWFSRPKGRREGRTPTTSLWTSAWRVGRTQLTRVPCSVRFCNGAISLSRVAGVCKMYEEHLKRMNPNSPSITYDISQLFDFIDDLADLSCLVWVSLQGGRGCVRARDVP